jgi:hypothetical protein
LICTINRIGGFFFHGVEWSWRYKIWLRLEEREYEVDLGVLGSPEEWLGSTTRRLRLFCFSSVLWLLLVLEADDLYANLIDIKVIQQDAFALCM